MQNRCCSSNDEGYVALTGWQCGSCGCENQGCDCCRNCGWNRCGCMGQVVRTEPCQNMMRSTCECECAAERQRPCGCAAEGRQANCDVCPPDRVTGQSVQNCPNNTTLRDWAAEATGCSCAVPVNQTNARQGCNSSANQTDARRSCGSTEPVNQTNVRQACSCTSSANHTNIRRSCGACMENRAAVRNVNAGVGMVYAVNQQLDQVYQPESALRTGTLFPELNKPLNGYCPGNCNCSTTGQQSAFAAWDLRLYLDTHPDDRQAQMLFSRLCREVEDPCYATAFLDGSSCGTQWDWTDDPWPWECQPCGQ